MTMDSILLGLSLYAPTISDEEKKGLELRFAEGRNANRCETCGVSIDKSMCYPLYHNDSWYNACSMCYMPANLDKIDYHKTGDVVFLPNLTQQQLNALMRAIWAVQKMASLDKNNLDLKEHADTMASIDAFVQTRKKTTKTYFRSHDTTLFAAMLDQLRPEEYRQRHKFLTSFRWIPEKLMYSDEMVYWAQKDYQSLDLENLSRFMSLFANQYTPGFKIKDE